MKAQLRFIESNDTLDWQAFAARESPDPWDDWGWFTVGIGPDGEEGTDLFQVVICTPTAKHKTLDGNDVFRGLIVDSFDPESIRNVIHEFVSSVTGANWLDCVRQLQMALRWEYEGMA